MCLIKLQYRLTQIKIIDCRLCVWSKKFDHTSQLNTFYFRSVLYIIYSISFMIPRSCYSLFFLCLILPSRPTHHASPFWREFNIPADGAQPAQRNLLSLCRGRMCSLMSRFWDFSCCLRRPGECRTSSIIILMNTTPLDLKCCVYCISLPSLTQRPAYC